MHMVQDAQLVCASPLFVVGYPVLNSTEGPAIGVCAHSWIHLVYNAFFAALMILGSTKLPKRSFPCLRSAQVIEGSLNPLQLLNMGTSQCYHADNCDSSAWHPKTWILILQSGLLMQMRASVKGRSCDWWCNCKLPVLREFGGLFLYVALFKEATLNYFGDSISKSSREGSDHTCSEEV